MKQARANALVAGQAAPRAAVTGENRGKPDNSRPVAILEGEQAAPAVDCPAWASELPCRLADWPELRARWGGLAHVRLTWPEGAAGLVAEIGER